MVGSSAENMFKITLLVSTGLIIGIIIFFLMAGTSSMFISSADVSPVESKPPSSTSPKTSPTLTPTLSPTPISKRVAVVRVFDKNSLKNHMIRYPCCRTYIEVSGVRCFIKADTSSSPVYYLYIKEGKEAICLTKIGNLLALLEFVNSKDVSVIKQIYRHTEE